MNYFAVEMNDPYSTRISNAFQNRIAILSGTVRDAPAEVPIMEADSNRIWLEILSLTMAELLAALSEKKPENPCLLGLLDAFAVVRSAEKRTVISSGKGRRLRSDTAGDETLSAGLSNRELDVLIPLQERLSNKEIAQRLFVSPETIKTHISNIYRKLSVNTRRQCASGMVCIDTLVGMDR